MEDRYNLEDYELDVDGLEDLGVDPAFAVATGFVETRDGADDIEGLNIEYDPENNELVVQGESNVVGEIGDYLEQFEI